MSRTVIPRIRTLIPSIRTLIPSIRILIPMSRSLIPMIGTLFGADAMGAANSCSDSGSTGVVLHVALIAPAPVTLFYRASHCALHARWSLHAAAPVASLPVRRT